MYVFLFFYKQVAREMASKLAVIFRHLVKGGNFPTCWRLADVVQVQKGSASSDVGDYRPFSITPVLLKVFEKIVGKKLRQLLESNSIQVALDRGMKERLD